MRVRMKVSMAGPGVLRPAGHECEVSDSEALSLFAANYAEPVRSVPVERATAPEPEKAVTRSAPKKRAAKKVPKK